MKKQFLTLLLVLSCSTALAWQDLQSNLIAPDTLKTAASLPISAGDADLILIEDITRLHYQSDGTYQFVSDMAFKILTEKGRDEQSMVKTGYNAAYGSTRFVRAEVIKPDGRVIPVDLDMQVREAIAQGQMDANIYDPSHKTLRLTVPDLEIGDVLRYSIAGRRDKTVVPGTWADWFTFEETYPIRHAVYEIDAPAALPLQRIELRDEIPGTVTFQTLEKDDRILYRWEARNVPRMFEEPQMPAPHTVVQRLLVSTIPDWESLSKWYWKLSQPRLDTVNSAMQEKVRELTDGLTDRQSRIEAIFRFVSQDIRYMGITVEDEAPGYEPHDVCLTFDNRYGVCRDKAALLVSMLRLAGFDAYPVLIYAGPKKDPDVPQPWFNHAITAVRNEDGSWMLMDSTDENTKDIFPAYLSDCSYLVATPEGDTLRTSPVIPPEENLLTIHVDASLDEQQHITGTANMQFRGINDTAYRGRLARLRPEEREPYFEQRLKAALGSARLLDLTVSPADVRDTTIPLEVTLKFDVENALALGEEESVLQVPTLINHFGLFGRLIGEGIGLDVRRYPLQTRVTCGIDETVQLDLSQSGLHPVQFPDYETIDTPELFISRNITETNDMLISKADILLRTVEFSPEEYLFLKQNLKQSERNARRRVILDENAIPPGSDRAILREEVVYTLYDDRNWKEERTVIQQVLTYAGTKEAAELKLRFNPALCRAELGTATVTAPDGTTREIDPATEINLMDAKWTAEAPRYPDEKILVASLPGVTPGSIIETRTTRVWHNTPFFSAAEFFADHHPILAKTVRVKTPHKLDLKIQNLSPDIIQRRTSHKDGWTVYEWSAVRQPKIDKEENLPPQWVSSPALFLSTGSINAYADQVQDVLRNAADQAGATGARAKALTKDMTSRDEKIHILRDFVDRTVRETGPAFPELPLSAVTPADRALKEGYGNNADRAVLLYALCRKAGLKPRFVLSSNLPRVERLGTAAMTALQRPMFDTVLVAVENDAGETIYLGDTGQYASPGTLKHAGRPAIDLHRDTLAIPSSTDTDSIETAFSMRLLESGDITLTKKTAFQGSEFETFHKRFAEFTPEEKKREHQSLLSRLSQSAEATGSLKTSFGAPGMMEFSARLPGYAIHNGKHIYFELPEGLGNLLNLQSSERENAFYIETGFRKAFLYEIELPDGWEPVLMPETFIMALPAGAGTVEVKTARLPGRLVVLQQAQINPAIIPVDEYNVLLDLTRKLTTPSASTVLLRKK